MKKENNKAKKEKQSGYQKLKENYESDVSELLCDIYSLITKNEHEKRVTDKYVKMFFLRDDEMPVVDDNSNMYKRLLNYLRNIFHVKN